MILREVNASRAVTFAATYRERFDFISPERDHAETTVLTGLPAVLPPLNWDGAVLLYDFVPNRVPLWSDGSVLERPHLLIKELRSKGYAFAALPVGALRWPTKINSNVTSPGLLLREA